MHQIYNHPSHELIGVGQKANKVLKQTNQAHSFIMVIWVAKMIITVS